MPNRILVVDDEPDLQLLIRQSFRQKIRNSELEFHFAGNGLEALEKLQTVENIDVVLSDINMPEMDGLTLLQKVDTLYPQLRSVVVSAYGDLKNIRTAMNNGAFDFVTKPIDFGDLETTLEKTLNEVMALKESQKSRDQLLAVQKELDIAQVIQNSFLPEAPPQPQGWEVGALFRPAREVAGDFYDAFMLRGSHRLGLVIADVCDKGVGPALYMALIAV